MHTSRGMTQLNGNVAEIYHQLYELTKYQMLQWEVKYHKLIMGKPHFDLLIDDKTMNSKNISFDKIISFLENN